MTDRTTGNPPPKGTRAHRSFFDRHLAPRLVHCVCSFKPFSKQRQHVVPQAEGVVLEIGMGSGHNIGYYDPAKVTKVIGIDPDETLTKIARRRALHSMIDIEVLQDSAEAMPLADALCDTALVTYSLCSIPNAAKALLDVRRVLKPGGRLFFVEHGRSTTPSTAKWQDRLNPYWNKVAGGCNINRDMQALITENGFSLSELETFKLSLTPGVLGFHYRGIARPRS